MAGLSDIDDMLGDDDSPSKGVDSSYRITANELRQFIERWERLQLEKQEIAEGQTEIMAEAQARGYDGKVMKKVIALRKRNADDIAEEDAVTQLYMEVLGMI